MFCRLNRIQEKCFYVSQIFCTFVFAGCIQPASLFSPKAWFGTVSRSFTSYHRENAGVPGGIPSGSWANCTTAACNTVNGGTVTASSINATVASATANSVIRIPAGTFTLSGSAFTNGVSNIVLRGAGPTNTKIILNGNNILLGSSTAGRKHPSGSRFVTNPKHPHQRKHDIDGGKQHWSIREHGLSRSTN